MKVRMFVLMVLLLLSGVTIADMSVPNEISVSHSGGTNSCGCHAGKKPYHCHNKRSPDPLHCAAHRRKVG